MSVSTTARKQQFVLDGVEDTFTFTFRALTSAPEDIKCKVTASGVETDLTYTTDFTVAINADGVGGTVTLVDPAGVGSGTLTVYRETTNTQESDYDDYNQFPADTLENDLDKRTMVAQESAEALARTAKLPISVTGADPELPVPSANKLIGWNSDGDGLENKTALDTDVQAACEAAQAAAELAQDGAETAETNAEAAQAAAEAAAANLPTIQAGDAYKILRVKSDESGNEYTSGNAANGPVVLDSSGRLINTTQPAFNVNPTTAQNNIAVGSAVTVVFGTERFDVGNNFASNTFTAPVTGKYLLECALKLGAIDQGATKYGISIKTSNKEYILEYDFSQLAGDPANEITLPFSIIADMDANDTVSIEVTQTGGAQQTDILTSSWFSGCLLF